MESNKKLINLFKGKVVSFSTADGTLSMKNIALESIEGRLFIVGQIPNGSTKNDWAADRDGAISWDYITDYIVFDNEAQYVELLAKSESD